MTLSRINTLVPVALISSATLGYEILLTRLFAIIQWHHFAYMVISIALLGFGASGALLSLIGRRLMGSFPASFAINAALFSVTSVAGFLLAQRFEFNPLELAWSFDQVGRLLQIYLLLLVPFVFAANAIGLALMNFAEHAARVYAWDLAGAGVGAAAIVGLLFLLPAEAALFCPAAVAAISGALAIVNWQRAALIVSAVIAALFAGLFVLLPEDATRLRASEFKALEQSLRVSGARLKLQRDSPLGRVSVVENPIIPLRHAPGLSVSAASDIPQQAALFVDGDGPAAITRFDGSRESIEFSDRLTSALPYHFVDTPVVLVVGAGGGADVLQAIYHRAKRIDVVELNSQIVNTVRQDYGDFSGQLFAREDVRIFVQEARGYAERSGERYDVLQISLSGSLVASGSGLHALSASHIYTVEGMSAMINLLRPGGFLAVTRWAKLPPRDGSKLFATAVTALEQMGENEPGGRIAWIRNWDTSTLLVKNGPWSSADSSTLRGFSAARGFDVAYYPGIRSVEANQSNQLAQPFFYDAARSILSDTREEFFDRYKFDIRPAVDDRPYFFNFFKMAHAREILALRAQGGMALVDLGYLTVWTTLVQSLLLGAAFIVFPLWLIFRRAERHLEGATEKAGMVLYFLCLGFGFIFIEVSFIHKFQLFLSHPLYAIAVVLAGFLVFAGLGSRFAMLGSAGRVGLRIVLPIVAIVLIGGGYLKLLPEIYPTLVQLSDPLRVLAALLLIAPLAFVMGMPFPVAIEALSAHRDTLIPLAWGTNGCASVVGAVLAALIAVSYGGAVVIAMALGLYVVAAVFGLPKILALRDRA